MSSNRIGGVVGDVNTIGAVTGDVTVATVPVSSTVSVAVLVTTNESTTPGGGVWSVTGCFTRGAGGAASDAAVVSTALVVNAALTTASVTLVLSGNDVVCRVTGIVGLTLKWQVVAAPNTWTP